MAAVKSGENTPLFIFPQNLVKNRHFSDADGDKPHTRFLF